VKVRERGRSVTIIVEDSGVREELEPIRGTILIALRKVGVGEEMRRRPKARDVIGELGVRTFINAAGTVTALTGSLMRPEVVAAL
jgi:hypothetical protein